MSRSRHPKGGARKLYSGYEYWASRLHPYGEVPGRLTKTWTHRLERREAKKDLRKDEP